MTCQHEWVHQNSVLLSDPPRQRRICELCGHRETVTLRYGHRPSYEELVRRFADGGPNAASSTTKEPN